MSESSEPADTRPHEVTELLQRAQGEGPERADALRELLPLLLDELRRIAGARMRQERREHTLQPTALVHEAFVRLVEQPSLTWKDRAQFLAVAAHAMRQVLVDHARARNAKKRGGDQQRVTLDEQALGGTHAGIEVLDLHAKLEALRELYERPARVVELRFFGGLTFEESGHVLGISPRTVESDWHFARSWLRRELKAREAE